MITTMTADSTKPNPLRRAFGAVLIPADRFEAWCAVAMQTEGLNAIELSVLALIATSYRQLHERGYSMGLSHGAMARHLGVEDSDQIRLAIHRLVELGLVGCHKRGAGRSHTYAMCLPRRLAATLAPEAEAEEAPPFWRGERR
jgi:hypothetical protein